jgi:long-chain acyl-CoA synthetase
VDTATKSENAESLEFQEFPEFKMVKDYLMEEMGLKQVNPNDHLEMDLGLDSLAKVNLQAFVHQSFGLNLTPEELIEYSTVKQLALFIQEKIHKIEISKMNWSHILSDASIKNIQLPKTTFVHTLAVRFLQLCIKLCFRMQVSGAENIPRGKPYILVPNHQSYLDGALLVASLARVTGLKELRRTFFYAKEKHVKSFFLSFVAKRANIITIDFNKDIKDSLQKLAAIIRQGNNVVIFAEGTRSRDGQISEFKRSFAILCKELQCPIVPLIINGSFEALPSGKHYPVMGAPIKLKFLPLVEGKFLQTRDSDGIRKDLRTLMIKEWEQL